MSLALAAASSAATTPSSRPRPRVTTGPLPSACGPVSPLLIIGTSAACVTSITIATAGATRSVTRRAPSPRVSSSTQPVATTRTLGEPACTRRSASSAAHAPTRSSSAREVRRVPASMIGAEPTIASSPTRTRLRACSPSVAPMSIQRSFICVPDVRSSPFCRWIGTLPITPGMSPFAVRTLTGWPTSTRGSQPPRPRIRSTPSSSMCVTMTPI